MYKSDFRVRRGLATRQVIIYGIALLVVGAAAYEFLVARPQFYKVWSELDQLALDGKAMNMTVEEVEQVMGREPASTYDDDFHNVHVRTYQWPSGLIIRPHTIHIVFVNSTVKNKEGDKTRRMHYFSSVANVPVTKKNYPLLRETIMTNLNLSGLAAGGPGGGGGGGEGGDDNKDEDKDKGDDPTDTTDPALGGESSTSEEKDAADKKEGKDEEPADADKKEGDDTPAEEPKPADDDGKDDSAPDPAKDDGSGDAKEEAEPGSGEPAEGEKPADEEKKDGEPAPGEGGGDDGGKDG